MTITKTITLYTFDELSDTAKEVARQWWREAAAAYHEWWKSTYDDADMVNLKITSFDLDHGEIDGEFTEDACACAHAIVDSHGIECETYNTATAFLAERDRIVDEAPKDEDGEFEDERELDNKLDEVESEFLHSILEDYRIMLQKEYEWYYSDDQVDEAITCNEYTFREDGTRED